MDKIGSSYIATPDLILFGGAILLYVCLTNLHPNSPIARVLALVCGLAILSIIIVIPVADNLTPSGIRSLAFVGFSLASSLWTWNKERLKAKPDLVSRGTDSHDSVTSI